MNSQPGDSIYNISPHRYERQLWDANWADQLGTDGGLIRLHCGTLGVFVLDSGEDIHGTSLLDPELLARSKLEASGYPCAALLSEKQQRSFEAALSDARLAVIIVVAESALLRPQPEATNVSHDGSIGTHRRWSFRTDDLYWILERLVAPAIEPCSLAC